MKHIQLGIFCPNTLVQEETKRLKNNCRKIRLNAVERGLGVSVRVMLAPLTGRVMCVSEYITQAPA